ncbi:MAG TPA: creatininase family protein [Armatimonadota bacterium]|nr:creatininase family protein [Armatimonadota bacterium]
MARKFKAEEMTPAEFKAAVEAKPVFILTTGILEWHGDHLPLGTDALKMRGLAERLAEEVGAILLPQNWFGVVGFDEMLGTITFSKSLVKRTLTEFFDNLEKMGAKLIVLLTGHYGPYQVETITEAAQEYIAHSTVRIIAQPEYEGVDFNDFPCSPDHADKYETSLMMALHPHLVQMNQYKAEIEIPYDYEYRDNAWAFKSPRGTWSFEDDLEQTASPQLGERLLAAIVAHLSRRIDEELSRLD